MRVNFNDGLKIIESQIKYNYFQPLKFSKFIINPKKQEKNDQN